MAWALQGLGLGQTGAANSLGLATPQPGSGVFAGPPTSAQSSAMSSGGASPSLPSGMNPAIAQNAAYYMSPAGGSMDAGQAYMLASMMSQQSSPWAALAAGAALPATEILKADLGYDVVPAPRATPIQVQGSGPLPFAGSGPSPNTPTTTDAMIAALL